MPLVEFSAVRILVANVVAWALAHGLSGYVAHRSSLERLRHDGPVLRLRPVETGGGVYLRRLHIAAWKDRLPEAGALFAGGVAKRRLPPSEAGGLERFAAETRRAERAHWSSLLVLIVFPIWNSPLGVLLMVIYGVAVNAPFIAVQRYNRARLDRILARRARRGDPVLRTTEPPPTSPQPGPGPR